LGFEDRFESRIADVVRNKGVINIVSAELA
jgi:hypothetical protein